MFRTLIENIKKFVGEYCKEYSRLSEGGVFTEVYEFCLEIKDILFGDWDFVATFDIDRFKKKINDIFDPLFESVNEKSVAYVNFL